MSLRPENTPTVSIVLPVYNAENFLRETIDSVLAQTLQSWELVIVDDGSEDESLKIARFYEQDERIKVFFCSNGGEASARTFGFEKTSTSSDFVMFLDHDDVLEDVCLETLSDTLQCSPIAVGAYGSGRRIEKNGSFIADNFLESWCRDRRDFIGGEFVLVGKHQNTSFASLVYVCCISSMSSCLLRRRYLPSDNLFRLDMRTGSADLHLYLRLALTGDFVFVDQPLYQKRQHSANITNNLEAVNASVLTALGDIARTAVLQPRQYTALQYAYRLKMKQKLKSCFGQARYNAKHFRFRVSVVHCMHGLACCIQYRKGV